MSPNEAPLLPAALRRAFEDAGFVEIRQRCQSDIPYREVAPRLINACLSLYNAADSVFERIGLGPMVRDVRSDVRAASRPRRATAQA